MGDQSQHQETIQKSHDFLKRDSGLFIVGGTNLTGKTALTRKIMENSGLTRYNGFDTISDPQDYFLEPFMTFVDFDDKPYNEAEVLKQFQDPFIQEAISNGFLTMRFDEIGARNETALSFIREIAHRHNLRIIMDVQSAQEGRGFFDDNANNHYISQQLAKHMDDLYYDLNLLSFNRNTLFESVTRLFVENPNGFMGQVRAYFPREMTQELMGMDSRLDVEQYLRERLGLQKQGGPEVLS